MKRYAKRIKTVDTTGLEISLLQGNKRSLQQLWRCGNNGNEFSFPLAQPALTCSKLTIETLEQGVKKWRQWRRSGVFIVNFEHISHLVLVFLLLTLNM